MEAENYEELHRAISALAAQCDGAISQDGVGFNGQDTKFGRRIAAMNPEEWTHEIAVDASRILPTYRNQLSVMGIDVKSLPLIVDDNASRYEARDQARKAEWERKHQPYVTVENDRGLTYKVYNSYPIKDELKRNGFRFNSLTKSWDAPVSAQGASTILGLGVSMSEELKADIQELASTVTVAIPGDVTISQPNIVINPQDPSRISLITEFGAIPLPVIRAIPGRKWDGANRVNVVDANVYLFKLAEEYNLTISDDASKLIESNREANENAKRIAEAAIADSIATDTDVEVAISDKLYPFQRAGVAYSLTHPRTLIGDEMGLGKTRQALSSIEMQNAYPCLVVCPATLKHNWAHEIKMLLPHRSYQVYQGRNGGIPVPMESDYLIINYQILESWAPYLPKLGGLVVDESHYIKNPKASRTATIKAITLGVWEHDKTDGRKVMVSPPKLPKDAPALFLTGTPVLNRPREIVEPLVCLGHLVPEKGRDNSVGKFLYRYCGPAKGWGGHMTFNGASNEVELNQWLRQTCMVRRRKVDVLTELPPKIRAPMFIALSDSAQRLYLKLAEEGAEKAAESRAEAIVYLNALRDAIGKAKIEQALEWSIDTLESTDKSLIIFADHIKVQKALIAGLENAGYYVTHILGGESSIAEEQKRIFQAGESRVIVLSLSAAREGHTLTKAHDVLFVELGWNPGTHNQAEDRAHRIGQDEPVTAWYLIAQDTIDEWTYELIESKRAVVNAVSDGIMSLDDDSSVFSEVLERAISAYGGKRN